MRGVLGNYEVKLQTKDTSQALRPTLSVTNAKNGSSVKIVYIDMNG